MRISCHPELRNYAAGLIYKLGKVKDSSGKLRDKGDWYILLDIEIVKNLR
jgi:hypothetical protein